MKKETQNSNLQFEIVKTFPGLPQTWKIGDTLIQNPIDSKYLTKAPVISSSLSIPLDWALNDTTGEFFKKILTEVEGFKIGDVVTFKQVTIGSLYSRKGTVTGFRAVNTRKSGKIVTTVEIEVKLIFTDPTAKGGKIQYFTPDYLKHSKTHWFISSTGKVQSAEDTDTNPTIIEWRKYNLNYFETKDEAIKHWNKFLKTRNL